MKKHLKTQGRDIDWHIYVNPDDTWSDSKVTIALLNDIREELKLLNAVLHCPNFMDIPHKLERIKRNTTKKRKPRAKGKPKLRVVG